MSEFVRPLVIRTDSEPFKTAQVDGTGSGDAMTLWLNAAVSKRSTIPSYRTQSWRTVWSDRPDTAVSANSILGSGSRPRGLAGERSNNWCSATALACIVLLSGGVGVRSLAPEPFRQNPPPAPHSPSPPTCLPGDRCTPPKQNANVHHTFSLHQQQSVDVGTPCSGNILQYRSAR